MLRIFRVLKLSPYLKQANYLMSALRGSKQKTAYEILSGLVGSEMCIRDR